MTEEAERKDSRRGFLVFEKAVVDLEKRHRLQSKIQLRFQTRHKILTGPGGA